MFIRDFQNCGTSLLEAMDELVSQIPDGGQKEELKAKLGDLRSCIGSVTEEETGPSVEIPMTADQAVNEAKRMICDNLTNQFKAIEKKRCGLGDECNFIDIRALVASTLNGEADQFAPPKSTVQAYRHFTRCKRNFDNF